MAIGITTFLLTANRRAKVLVCCLGTILAIAGTCLAVDQEGSPSCYDGNAGPAVDAHVANARPTTKASEPHRPRTIKLTWKASVPASHKRRDEVWGYYIWRNQPGDHCKDKPCQRITEKEHPITGTSCIDAKVAPGNTYVYYAQAVSKSGALSSFSNLATAKLP
jgi:hypothetical protein